MLILLALITSGVGIGDTLALINMGWTEGSESVDFELEPVTTVPDVPKTSESEMESGTSLEIAAPSFTETPSLESSLESVPALQDVDVMNEVAASAQTALASVAFASTNIESRSRGSRQEAVAKRGGSPASEQAVENALKWLTLHQNVDGGWSCRFNHEACKGECRHSGKDNYRVAATGMALLCYLGAGYTHQEGPYQDQVKRGLYYLRLVLDGNPVEGRFPDASARFAMYEQGIAALAVCEAYQMTKDADLREMVQKSVRYIEYAQHDGGGWGYDPGMIGDLSIACWQMMALKSADGSEVWTSGRLLKRFDRFLDSQQTEGGSYYGYAGPGKRPGTTAMGLLMRMYRGWGQTDPRLLKGMAYLAERGPSPNDPYYNYYATQVLFHHEGPFWEPWNLKMREFLVANQAQQGHEAGSWYFNGDKHGETGGRLYATALSCMTLEVYYRHMPIYAAKPMEEFKF